MIRPFPWLFPGSRNRAIGSSTTARCKTNWQRCSSRRWNCDAHGAAPVVISGIFGNDGSMAGEKMLTGEKTMTGAKVLLLCVSLAASACNRDSGSTAPPPKPVAHIKSKATAAADPVATAAEQTAGMVQAPSQGKSVVPVELKFDIAQR